MEFTAQDVAMEDVTASEPKNIHTIAFAETTAGVISGAPPSSNIMNSMTRAPKRPATPPLKGAGLRRDGNMISSSIRKDLPQPAKFSNLPYSTSQTGLVYDVRMRFHVEAIPTEDDVHPEDPRRIHAIFEAFVGAGLAWREGISGPSGEYYMGRIDARLVTMEEVCLVHSPSHWNWVQQLSTKTAEELADEKQHPRENMDSVYLSASTPYCAGLSAGGAIEACRAIMLGKVKNAFAVIRPPGHHAEREDAKGFCFFDNVSIATKVCQLEFGERCRKVFILDWDVHHGNGIQQANYEDPNVLYISLHVHKRGFFYPELSYRDNRGPYGDHLHCGAGAGLGKNVNIPWSKQGMGDADYIYAFQQVVMPIATEFDPDLVIIAAGFDAAEGDMLGGCKVTPAGYAHMTHMLMSLADGKVAVCLEGGYNLESIARSACAVGRTLMGEPPDRLQNLIPTDSGVDDVKLVLRQQSRFWASLYPKDLSTRMTGPLRGERLHNVVRRWQADTLFDRCSMTPLFIHRDHLAAEFENQVLATPNYNEARPLLVILHDPPEVLASPDPRTGNIELHNTWLTDVVKSYIDWAVDQKFAVIDVNLPKHISDYNSDSQSHEETDSVEFRINEAQQLLTYLWDNYIELSECTHVFLMGTNTGHGGIINFIKANESRAQELINKAISFVEDVPLMSCKSPTNDLLPGWYYATSLVFVAQEHNFWFSDYGRKPKKRFGTVYKSPESSMTDMLAAHRQTVIQHLLAATEQWRREQPASDEEGMDLGVPAPGVTRGVPPIGNFAVSPARKVVMAERSPGGGGLMLPQGGTSPPKIPPGSNPAVFR